MTDQTKTIDTLSTRQAVDRSISEAEWLRAARVSIANQDEIDPYNPWPTGSFWWKWANANYAKCRLNTPRTRVSAA